MWIALSLIACGPARVPDEQPDLSGDSAPPVEDTEPPPEDTDPPPEDSAPPPEDSDPPPEDTAPPADCEPSVVVADAHVVEGDQVVVTAACAGPEPAAWSLEPLELPAGALWDPAAGALTWRTGLEDGGRHELVFVVRPQFETDAIPESVTATVWVADAIDDPANVPPDPATYTEEWGLPVIHVSPHGWLSDSYVTADVYFQGERYDAEVKIRGASSYYYPKNSYTLNFGEVNLDASDYGLPDKDHLVLTTPFDDNSYVRQKLAYDVWQEMAAYWDDQRLTIRTFFAVLYMDGGYVGLYTAMDHVDDQFIGDMGYNREGNVYKAVNHDANFYRKANLTSGYEKTEGDPGDWSDLEALVYFTGQDDTATFLDEADQWINLEEFMDWLLFVHFTSSDDSGGKNSYLYNDPADTAWRYAPWDFNHSFGQTWQTIRLGPDVYNSFKSTNAVFNHIQSDPEADAALWDRLHQMMKDGPLSPGWFVETLDDYYAQIDDSAARDWSRWGDSYYSYWYYVRNGCADCLDYEGEKQYLYDWLAERDSWMRSYH
jgi:spore coat protein H